MFRPLLTTSLIALCAPAFADTFTGEASVDAVTIYPGLATVTRQVTLDLPTGQHEIIVPGLPEQLATESLRLSAPQGVQLGAVSLAHDRLPVTPDQTSSEILAAKDKVARLEDVLRQRDAEIAEIRLQVIAAEEQIAFLQSLSQASAGETLTTSSITDIQALAQMVGAETLAVRKAAFEAEQEAQASERAREDDVEALDDAQRALNALMAPEQDGSVLTFSVVTAEAGEVTIDVSTQEGFANWSPVYDMRLTTGDAPTLDLDRSVVVGQHTGQDWTDVKLVLSTARPGEQIAPSGVWAPLRRIVSEDELQRDKMMRTMEDEISMEASDIMGSLASPLAPAPSVQATADFSGAAVTYTYPGRVSIRNGVDDLRLPLDTLSLDADIWAEAAPSRDNIAYRVAEFTNDTQELLLPGKTLMFADGTMIGFSSLPMIATGAETQMGFGPLDGIVLNRMTPNKSEGERGVFSSSNQLEEEAVITVENLTGQDWDVLLRDAVPYSEQDDLEVEVTASPTVTRTNPEGRRGILEWDLSVPAGKTQEITLDYTLTWPSGYVLQ
ncbi:mucoidy inhibitor MuiA family protein [Yoonia maritima]|uniref:mucoidy inhibitor MuiA family protein n=1 Tax=Yoonia maritima TaxID=1435347 RepID=UPI000D0F1980|nr:mucoidy inhibitor MuiA family protein [Yoonia maritima]